MTPVLTAFLVAPQGGVEAVRDIRRTWQGYKARIIAVTADAFEARQHGLSLSSRA